MWTLSDINLKHDCVLIRLLAPPNPTWNLIIDLLLTHMRYVVASQTAAFVVVQTRALLYHILDAFFRIQAAWHRAGQQQETSCW